MDRIAEGVVQSAYRIIEAKGYTNLTIGVVIARLVDVILVTISVRCSRSVRD